MFHSLLPILIPPSAKRRLQPSITDAHTLLIMASLSPIPETNRGTAGRVQFHIFRNQRPIITRSRQFYPSQPLRTLSIRNCWFSPQVCPSIILLVSNPACLAWSHFMCVDPTNSSAKAKSITAWQKGTGEKSQSIKISDFPLQYPKTYPRETLPFLSSHPRSKNQRNHPSISKISPR